LSGAAATLGGVATAMTAREEARAQATPLAISVATAPTVDATAFYYAMSAGLFTRAGLDITIKKVASGSLGIVALVGNDATVAFANLLSAVVAREKGIPLQAVAPAALYDSKTPIARLFAAASSTINSAKDLENRTVAITGLHDLLGLSVKAWADQRGADLSKIRFVEMPAPTMLPALQAGRVDALVVYEPFSSDIVASGIARTIGFPYDAIARQFTVDAWLSLSTWTDANREATRRFAQVIRAAAVYANAHLTEMQPIVASSTGLPEDVIRRALVAKLATDVLPSQLQPLIDAALKFKEIAQPLAAREMIYRT
jgi:NitT/TauT family transport system substrate-binding protein